MTLPQASPTLVCLILAWPAFGQDLRPASPESVQLSSQGLERATQALQAHVDAGHIAGVVAAVARDGKLVYYETLGFRDLRTEEPMPKHALFRIYSMTRSITSAAAMILWEEGKFRLDDPISMYLPEFSDQRVFVDASAPNMARTRPRNGDITIENLLTHTSGLGSRSSRIYQTEQVRSRSLTLSQMVENAARVPLFEDPDTRFRYGISTTVLGRLIEIWSDMQLDQFLKERIFKPLEMTDTTFWADGQRAKRLAIVYRPAEVTGSLSPYAIEDIPFTEPPLLIEGGVGLLSSTKDFLKFSQMFLNRGELDRIRVLQPKTVELMTVNRVPRSALPLASGGYMRGSGWGLGFNVVMDTNAYSFPVSQGEFWWDGSAGTRFSIDPVQGIVTVIMAQVSPSNGGGFREEFKTLVYDAILDER